MPGIWHETVQTDSEAAIHATLFLVLPTVVHSEELVAAMQSIVRWRTSCKNCLATHPTAVQQDISKADKAVTTQLVTVLHRRIHGTDQRLAQAMLHLGNAINKTVEATIRAARFRRGSNSSSNHETRTTTATLLPAAVLLRGNNKLLRLLRHKTTAMAVTSNRAMVKMAMTNHQRLLPA